MATAKKHYARYFIVRDLETMWRGDAATSGSPFREFVITSNEFNSTLGTFQVYALEGMSGGIKEGKLAPSDQEPKVLFDQDFSGLQSAVKQFELLVDEAKDLGFKAVSTMEMLEFESKLRDSSAH
jgi:hypothetical protein